MHVVTANKGPVAFALRPLRALARREGRSFRFEGAVLDGTPLFNMVERTPRRLPHPRLSRRAQQHHHAHPHRDGKGDQRPRRRCARRRRPASSRRTRAFDLDGWDAAVKGCAIANALMGAQVTPRDVRRTGIGAVTVQDVSEATAAGARLRLVVRGHREGRQVLVSVAPERIVVGDLLVSPGCDGVVVLQTDLMREVGIWEGAGGVDQTAYALLSDLLAIVDGVR